MKGKVRANLDAFYITYLNWLEAGAPDGMFNLKRSCGLCGNIVSFLEGREIAQPAYHMLHDDMRNAGIEDTHAPFNENIFDFLAEANGGECHLNPERRAFVEYMVRRIRNEA